MINRHPAAQLSLAEVMAAAIDMGVAVEGVQASLAELVALDRPAILHLTQPDHYCVLAGGSQSTLQLLNYRSVGFEDVPMTEVVGRYSGAALVPVGSTDPARARAEVLNPVHAFEPTPMGGTVQAQYTLHNAGGAPLAVKQLSTSCSCTSAQREPVVLQPGASTTIEVTLQVTRLGAITEFVTLETDDPLRPRVLLSLHGTSGEGLVWRPLAVYLSGIKGDTVSRMLRLFGPLGLVIHTAWADDEAIDVTLTETVVHEDHVEHVLLVTTHLNALPGTISSDLTIHTNHPDFADVVIPCRIEARSPVQCSPPRLVITRTVAGQPVAREVVLTVQPAIPWRLVSVHTSDPAVACTVVDGQPADRLRLAVISTPPRSGLLEAEIVVVVDALGEERVVIPVTVEAR